MADYIKLSMSSLLFFLQEGVHAIFQSIIMSLFLTHIPCSVSPVIMVALPPLFMVNDGFPC
jgi:hypothetical protein